jgi:chromosome segregation ATPase
MLNHELMEILESLDQRVEELVSEVMQLRSEREQLRQELEETRRNYETTSRIAEESQQKRVVLEEHLHNLDSGNTAIREKIQKIIERIEEMEG